MILSKFIAGDMITPNLTLFGWAHLLLLMPALVLPIQGAIHLHMNNYECRASSDARGAMQSDDDVTFRRIPGVGYGFHGRKIVVPSYFGGPNVTRGVMVVPETGVDPEAYVPLARALALRGSYAVVLDEATEGHTLRAMRENSHLQYWVLAGHGDHGGTLAAELICTLQPRVKGLILMAARIPPNLDMSDQNVVVVVLYGQKDSVVPPEAVEESFSRMPGDSGVTLFPNLGHFDFASTECVGNGKGGDEKQGLRGLMDQDFGTIVSMISSAVSLSSWAVASEKALSFSDNEKLAPGHVDSKVYPGDIQVRCTQVPIPDTSPQVFTPSKIKAGLVYYPGGAVDARAYFPLAFEIAAREHLVVIIQMPFRNASLGYQDANTVIDSKEDLFSGVPKAKWALGGHSAGAYAATKYAAEFRGKIYAVVIHAGGWGANLTENPLPIASIYGTLDAITPGMRDNTDPPPLGRGPLVNLRTSKSIPIKGANHYQVGDYGYQSPDQVPTISMEQQAGQFANETVRFLDNVHSPSWWIPSTPRTIRHRCKLAGLFA